MVSSESSTMTKNSSEKKKSVSEAIGQKLPLTEEILDQFLVKVDRRQDEPEMPTGLIDLDNLTWGLNDGELFVVSARTKNGKTSLATQIAWNIAKAGHYVIFVSLEMSGIEIISRIISQEYEIDGFENFRKGRMTPEIRLKVIAMRTKIQELNFQIVDDFGFDSEQIVELVEALRTSSPFPRLIVVDHIQRARIAKGQSKFEAVSSYVNALKYISQHYKCAVLACSQLNRMNNDPKWSSEIEEACDTLLKCKWPRDDVNDISRYEIDVAYNRFGPCDKIDVNFQPQYCKFTNRYYSGGDNDGYAGKDDPDSRIR